MQREDCVCCGIAGTCNVLINIMVSHLKRQNIHNPPKTKQIKLKQQLQTKAIKQATKIPPKKIRDDQSNRTPQKKIFRNGTQDCTTPTKMLIYYIKRKGCQLISKKSELTFHVLFVDLCWFCLFVCSVNVYP